VADCPRSRRPWLVAGWLAELLNCCPPPSRTWEFWATPPPAFARPGRRALTPPYPFVRTACGRCRGGEVVVCRPCVEEGCVSVCGGCIGLSVCGLER
jgi:hypothetical protein